MGWIADTITLTRDAANESSVNAKWTDAKIITLLEQAFSLLVPEIFRNADGPTCVRWDLATTSGTSVYQKPPHVGEILQIAKVDSNNRVEWRIRPSSRWNPSGPGVTFDGPTIRFEPDWKRNDTLRVWYIPNGEISLAEGVLSGTHTTSAVQVAAATTGSLDTRQNAYAGYILSVTDAGDSQRNDRIITSSSHSSGAWTFNVEPAFDFTPANSDAYELRPVFGVKAQMAVALQAALFITSFERMKTAEASVQRRLTQVLRELRLSAANQDQIVGQHFRGDTWDNERLAGYEYGGVRY